MLRKRTVNGMKRDAIQAMINWKNDEERKPLVLRGARQAKAHSIPCGSCL